jgi:hypothetical protein
MRQISQIADRLLSLVVPAAEAKATSCGNCYYTGLSDQDPACWNGYIFERNCPSWGGSAHGCVNNYSWQCS